MAAPVFTFVDIPSPVTVNSPYSGSVSATGISLYTTGFLPPGINFLTNGNFTGTPTQVGSWTFTVTTGNKDGETTSIQATIVVEAVPSFTLINIPSPTTVNLPYSGQVEGTGVSLFTTGTLPPGILFFTNGNFGGTPTQVGSWTFTITTADKDGVGTSIQATIVVASLSQVWVGSPTNAFRFGMARVWVGSPTNDFRSGIINVWDGSGWNNTV